MTRIRLCVLATVLLAAACGSRTEGLDRTKLPEDIKADYDLFARKCSKCHGLARPLQSGITDDEQWVLYENRMRRQQGSGISYSDQEHILRFLKYYAADLRRKEAEKRGLAPPAAPAPTGGAIDAAVPAPEEPKDGG
jgi:hypothetical protein